MLAAHLESAGHTVRFVREPGGTPVGEEIRTTLLTPRDEGMSPTAEALLFAASRAELVDRVIGPAVSRGEIVIADRFVDSSAAYQGAARGLGVQRVLDANALAIGDVMPDITVLVRVSIDEAHARRAAGGEGDDRIEAEGSQLFTATANAFDELAAGAPDRFIVVDGSGSVDDVNERLMQQLSPRLAAVTGSDEAATAASKGTT